MENYSYILISNILYEGTWVEGVVQSLDEALSYFSKTVKPNKLKDNSSEELVTDNWEDEYCTYWVQKWQGTRKISTYKYNTKTGLLEEQPK